MPNQIQATGNTPAPQTPKNFVGDLSDTLYLHVEQLQFLQTLIEQAKHELKSQTRTYEIVQAKSFLDIASYLVGDFEGMTLKQIEKLQGATNG